MKAEDLQGRFFRVVDASDFRILLETDSGTGEETNKFVLVTASPIQDADHGFLEVKELK